MIRRPVFAAALASAALLSGFGLAGRALAATSIGTASVSPGNLPATGGSVTVSVTISGVPAGGKVQAAATAPGGSTYGSPITLTRQGTTTKYTGKVSIAPNSVRSIKNALIKITVLSGTRTVASKQTGVVKVAAASGGTTGGDNTPPAPPRI